MLIPESAFRISVLNRSRSCKSSVGTLHELTQRAGEWYSFLPQICLLSYLELSFLELRKIFLSFSSEVLCVVQLLLQRVGGSYSWAEVCLLI